MTGIACDMDAKPTRTARVQGKCAKCGGVCYECEAILSDAYAVWFGRCPHCKALNQLKPSKGMWRGYDSRYMNLELPSNEEIIMNEMPLDTPSRGWTDPANRGKSKEQLIAIYG